MSIASESSLCNSGLISNEEMHAYNREHAFTNLFTFFPSLTNEPICLFFKNPLRYILIGNRVHVKSSGLARGLANARPLGSAKFANAPPPGLTRRANAPQ